MLAYNKLRFSAKHYQNRYIEIRTHFEMHTNDAGRYGKTNNNAGKMRLTVMANNV